MSLFRVPKPRPAPSPARKAKWAAYALEKEVLRLRCRGLCEGCGCDLRINGGGDAHHIFGRAGTGARLGWPWCDLAENLAALCRACHDRITDGTDGKLDTALKRQALRWMCKRFGVLPVPPVGSGDWVELCSPVDLNGLARRVVELAAEMEQVAERERLRHDQSEQPTRRHG